MTGLLTQYLGAGLLADRPETPDVLAGTLVLYHAEDEGVIYKWTHADPDVEDSVGSWQLFGVSDAPADSKAYLRKDGAWYEYVEPEIPDSGITDAPNDSDSYVRSAGGWIKLVFPEDQVGLPEAPQDGKQYARKDGQWFEVESTGGGDASYPDFAGNAGKLLAVTVTEDSVEWVDAPSGGGGEPATSLAKHRYWRLAMPVSSEDVGANYAYAVAELQFRETPGGPNLAVGGVPFANLSDVGTEAAKAFDGNPATFWAHLYGNGAIRSGREYYLGYDFGLNPVAVTEVYLQARNEVAAATQAPRQGRIEYSDDGVNYVTAWEYTRAVVTQASQGFVTTRPIKEVTIAGGGSNFESPNIVQSVYSRMSVVGNVNLPAAPTPGNTLLMIATGAGASGMRPPVGWDVVIYTANSDVDPIPGNGQRFQRAWAATKIAQPGDVAAIPLPGTNDITNLAVYELGGACAIEARVTIPKTTGTQFSMPVFRPRMGPSRRFVMVEHDEARAITMTPADGLTVLNNFGGASNHYASIGSVLDSFNRDVTGNVATGWVYPIGIVVAAAKYLG